MLQIVDYTKEDINKLNENGNMTSTTFNLTRVALD